MVVDGESILTIDEYNQKVIKQQEKQPGNNRYIKNRKIQTKTLKNVDGIIILCYYLSRHEKKCFFSEKNIKLKSR